ncbi:ThuA domain-containing protein [Wenxinia saemankumensis]|uniref:ThuA-like domain-containing protein n=1 Tax=Wenxinia saemankumensis TaxID=1447782 RepID=A0A1M6APP1_9RHOB|nr:ThuA domain-containing protein [Wenxinia saemankumensis]SHI38298.1 hypothetical protein SAMN05444417_0548 [Wenxinia saemankumensis]
MAKALITWGGWEGHEPEQVAGIFARMLDGEGMEVHLTDSLAPFDDGEALRGYALIVPVWTMSELSKEAARNVSEAVARGTGLAGCHGGMCDAFRSNVLWQFVTGANWVAHPGGDGVDYTVDIVSDDPLVAGIESFPVSSEQYYLHVDPANEVLATTRFPTVEWYHAANGPVDVPVAWKRVWGNGRVYYNALGHKASVIAQGPAHEMLRRGLVWAAEGKAAAGAGDVSRWAAEGNHY